MSAASLQKLKGMQSLKLQCRYVKGVPVVYRRYLKEALILLKMVYKRKRGWTLRQSLPIQNYFEYPLPSPR